MQPKVEEVRDNYCIGIVDDVTFTSLSYGTEPETLPEHTTECKFWCVLFCSSWGGFGGFQ